MLGPAPVRVTRRAARRHGQRRTRRAYGKPLDGVRVLALEQMQALPYATQLLARLGADVVKVEHPVHGESGRGVAAGDGRPRGPHRRRHLLRNNLNKRSVGIDLKAPEGRELFLALAPRFDVVAENFKAGTMDRMGLGYDDDRRASTRRRSTSRSRASATRRHARTRDWPAYASIVEAMSGIYDYKRQGDEPPVTIPVGALGDISSALFAVIGILAALRHRDRTGEGQYVDIAMLDAMVAMTDIVTNFWSLGLHRPTSRGSVICDGFRAVRRLVRRCRSSASTSSSELAELVGHPEWTDDPRFATRAGLGAAPRGRDPPRRRGVGVAAARSSRRRSS